MLLTIFLLLSSLTNFISVLNMFQFLSVIFKEWWWAEEYFHFKLIDVMGKAEFCQDLEYLGNFGSHYLWEIGPQWGDMELGSMYFLLNCLFSTAL